MGEILKESVDGLAYLCRFNTQVFMFGQHARVFGARWIEYKHMLKRWSLVGQGLLCQVVYRKELVYFAQSFVASCNAGVQQLVAVSRLHARHGFDVVLDAGFYKIKHCTGVVDVGEHKGFNALGSGVFHQCLGREGAIQQAVKGVGSMHLRICFDCFTNKINDCNVIKNQNG